MDKLIRDMLEESGEQFADLPAIRWLEKKEIRELSYRELLDRVADIRRGLYAGGFAGAHIALLGSSSPEWIGSYLGIVTGGNVAVPLDAALPLEDLIDLLDRSDAQGLFVDLKHLSMLKDLLASCPKLKKVWLFGVDTQDLDEKVTSLGSLTAAGQAAPTDAGRPAPEDVCTIIFTSGTTGKSKGVMLTQRNLAENVRCVAFDPQPGTVLMSVLPIHHAFCLVMDWLKSFSVGAVVCINDSLLHIARNMGLFKPDVMLMVPLMVETIYKKLSALSPLIPKKLAAQQAFGGNLHTVFVGGAHLDPFYIEKFAKYGVEVLEGYGMSECSPVISVNLPEEHRAGSIGKLLSNVELAFEDGEILVRGSSVMKGYYRMPQETDETLRDGWLHTGDKGYLDEDGFLYINGRVKNLIILSNGENVSPEEIENKLALGPLVGEVVVTGEDNGLTARVYPDQDLMKKKKLDGEGARAALQTFLDQYNKGQPTYRHITGLVVRQYPFARNTTKKIIRAKALLDEPLA